MNHVKRHLLYQLAVDLVVPSPESLPEVYKNATDTIYDWLEERLQVPISPELRKYGDYTLGMENPIFACEAIHEEYLWTARLMQTSSPFERDRPIPERSWTSDIALQRHENNFRLGINVSSVSMGQALNIPANCGKLSVVERLALGSFCAATAD